MTSPEQPKYDADHLFEKTAGQIQYRIDDDEADNEPGEGMTPEEIKAFMAMPIQPEE